ncbi:hypothetical protein Lser_V15G01763 [Lactuca serriola]
MSMMGKINNFLGLNICQSREGILINHEKYSRNLLENFGMMNSLQLRVHMVVGTHLGPSFDKPVVDVTQCQSNPREPHLTAINNIFRYLKGTVLLGLRYPLKTGFFIQVFSDVDLGGCQLDRKSMNGGCQLLDWKLFSWQSNKQMCVSISTAEAEYVAATACTSQIIWIQSRSCDYATNMKKILLYCDSQSAICICHNPM